MYAIRSYYDQGARRIGLFERFAQIAARRFDPQGQPQILARLFKTVGGLAQLGHVLRLQPASQADLLSQFQQGATGETEAEIAAGDVRQLMGLVEYVDLGIRITSYNVCYTKLLRLRMDD